MTVAIEVVAEALGLEKEELIKNGVKAYLETELRRLSIEITTIYNKYRVKSLRELDEKISKGELGETDTLDDFTKLDYIEARRGKVEELLRNLGFAEVPA